MVFIHDATAEVTTKWTERKNTPCTYWLPTGGLC